MCDICLHSPCLSRCPNASEPKHIECQCRNLYEDEEYYEINGVIYCEDCIKEYLDWHKKYVEFIDFEEY